MLKRRISAIIARRRTLDTLARQVAEASVEGVCHMVGDRMAFMTICEARGYIRARAAQEIRRQTRLALSNQAKSDSSWERMVAARATERVTPLAMRRLAAARANRVAACDQPTGRRAA